MTGATTLRPRNARPACSAGLRRALPFDRLAFAALALGACGAEPPSSQPARAPAGAPAPPADPAPRFRFRDTAAEAGLRAVTWCGRPEKPHLLESNGNGLALFDADGDGDLDLFVTSGWRLEGDRVAERATNRMYRNRGDGTFDDVTGEAGVGGDGFALGCAVGDFDSDGLPDLLVTNFGPDDLWRNEGGGRFAKVPGFSGIDGWSPPAVFFDADGDGDDDLWIGGYVDCAWEDVLRAEPSLDWKGVKVMQGPFGLKGLANRFWRNEGGRYVEATAESGLADAGTYFSFAAAACDFDGDLDLDLYVANDSNPNYLYRNDGGGKFTEVGLWCGAALSAGAASQAGMSVIVGDYDLDGRPDICVSNFAEDSSALYRNLGRMLFKDVSAETGLRGPTFEPLKWGGAFADFDLDGDEDLFVACGHIYPQADGNPASRLRFAQTNLLLENAGGRFADASPQAGPGLADAKVSHGVAAGDVDDDGDVDLVIANVDAPPTLLRNDAQRQGGWIVVDAAAAVRATVEAGGKRQTRWRVRGGSFCSESDPRFHFGLGQAAKADRVVVTWPDGRETEVRDVRSGSRVRVPRPR